jgi:hypothetical protein
MWQALDPLQVLAVHASCRYSSSKQLQHLVFDMKGALCLHGGCLALFQYKGSVIWSEFNLKGALCLHGGCLSLF